jgi:hypothetical protein
MEQLFPGQLRLSTGERAQICQLPANGRKNKVIFAVWFPFQDPIIISLRFSPLTFFSVSFSGPL